MAMTNGNDHFGVLSDPMLGARRRFNFPGARSVARFIPRPGTPPAQAARQSSRFARKALWMKKKHDHQAALAMKKAAQVQRRDDWMATKKAMWQRKYSKIKPVTLSSNGQPAFLLEAFAEQSPFANTAYPMLGAKKKKIRVVTGTPKRMSKWKRMAKTVGRAAKSKTFKKIAKVWAISAAAALAVAGAIVVGPALLSSVAGKSGVGVGKLGGMLAKIKSFRKKAGLPPISAATLGEEASAAKEDAAAAGQPINDDQALAKAEQKIAQRFGPGSPETAGEANRAAAEMIPAAALHADAAALPPKEAAAAEAAAEQTVTTIPTAKPTVARAGFDVKWLVIAAAAAAVLSMLSQKSGIRTKRA
jgi:hypothetical protein